MRLTFLSLTLLIPVINTFAIDDNHIKLDTVIVVANKIDSRGGVGVKKSIIDKVELNRNATRTLSELLQEGTSLQIKSMGQGAQSTISFRGTSSNHTQVLWNGISINSPQLGCFDFSQVPVYFIDNITLTHGSATPYATAGALGGSINFSGENSPVEALRLNIISEIASNETFTEAATVKFTYGKLTSTTRAYYQQSENNYKYINKVYSNEHTVERRKEADYKQGGLMQEITYRLSEKNVLNWSGWLQMDDRSLPQSIIVNVTASEQSKSTNYRTMLNYQYKGGNNLFASSMAYLRGEMDYNREFGEFTSDHNRNIYNSIVANAEYKYIGWRKFVPSILANYRFDDVSSDNYTDNYQSRNSYSTKLLLAYYPLSFLQIDGSTTLQCIDKRVFGTYSLSARLKIIPRLLELKASQSYNHRVPTLNDLYWSPGGNPDLDDEKSMGYDVSLSSECEVFSLIKLDLEATYYDMDVDNWITWIPKGNGYIWEPVNFSKVRSRGAEFNGRIRLQTGAFNHSLTGVYTYASSIDQSARVGDAAHGKQIAYVPRNRWSAGYRVTFKDKFWFHYNSTYTGVRFTSADESYQTNAYTLHNFETGYKMNISNAYKIGFSVKLENAFNAFYESTQYYPMPLRMCWARVTFDL